VTRWLRREHIGPQQHEMDDACGIVARPLVRVTMLTASARAG
jgi:hypothetical protein